MPIVDINLTAIFTAALVNMAMGALWYSRYLFGSEWVRLVGKSMQELRKGSNRGYFIAAIGALIMAYVFAHFIQYVGANNYMEGAIAGFWLWLGFVAVTSATNSMFAGRPLGLWRIDASYFLVVMLINGALLAAW